MRRRTKSAAGVLVVAAAAGFAAALPPAPSQQASLSPSSAGNVPGLVGRSASIWGDTAVLGGDATNVAGAAGQGAAYVFVRSGSAWSQQAELVAPDGAGGHQFGFSSAISGDTIVVGAYQQPIFSGGGPRGAAYVFTRSGTAWSLQQKLVLSDPTGVDRFGYSVAIEGDTILVGAPTHSGGAVYVFTRGGGTWTEKTRLTSGASESVGASVALSGGTAVLGAPGIRVPSPGPTSAGGAYVFTGSGATWTQQAKLMASDPAQSDFLGDDVAISGDSVVIAGYRKANGANLQQGAAYVFTRTGGAWSEQQKLMNPAGAASDQFGAGVAIEGDTLLVTEIGTDLADLDVGSCCVYVRSGGVWSVSSTLYSALTLTEGFGMSAALYHGTAVVGATGRPGGGGATVFIDVPSTLPPAFDPDSDRDGVPDSQETAAGTSTLLRDSDGDGIEDGVEIRFGSNPLSAASPSSLTDTNRDGMPDAMETTLGFGAGTADRDGDGIRDGFEYAKNGSLGGVIAFGDPNFSGGRPDLADAQLLTKITLGTAVQGAALDQDLDIDRSMGAPKRADATLLTYFAQGRIPYLPYP